MTTITSGARVYDVAFDRTLERRALVTGMIVDAISGAPPRERVTIRIDRRGLTVRMGSGGLFALSGRELLQDLNISLSARRYAPRTLLVPIASNPAFPIDLGPIALRPLPVRLEGRVTREMDRKRVDGASISFCKSDKLLLLRRPLYASRPSGTTVTACTATVDATRGLAAAAPAGTRTFTLDDTTGLAAGGVLRFDQREYGVIESVATATVDLMHPLHRSYRVGTSVEVITVTNGTATTTARDVDAGEALLPVTDPFEADAVAIGGPPEYHDVGVVADADGYFAVDGIGGERTLTLITAAPDLAKLKSVVAIDYGNATNSLSLRLKKKGDEPCLNT